MAGEFAFEEVRALHLRGHPLITSRRSGGGGYTDLVTVRDGKIWGVGVIMEIRDVTCNFHFLQHFRCSEVECTAITQYTSETSLNTIAKGRDEENELFSMKTCLCKCIEEIPNEPD